MADSSPPVEASVQQTVGQATSPPQQGGSSRRPLPARSRATRAPGQPLSKGVSAVELERTGAAVATGAAETSLNQYSKVGVKWHTAFIIDARWSTSLIKQPGFLKTDGQPDDEYIETFFKWLWGDPAVLWPTFKTCLSWCQNWINTERLKRHKLAELPSHVRRIPVVMVHALAH
eukprot:TRINITY_DN5418_c0_g1_i2.p1 TRINITY_DN5418_c0_g1~~TRINITY_DN5418_c0_g1_i2.p1  ORF type:complete len:174 (-),score=21.34 TRINITY_DN5418_c0_g1_i2:288-809(-)